MNTQNEIDNDYLENLANLLADATVEKNTERFSDLVKNSMPVCKELPRWGMMVLKDRISYLVKNPTEIKI
jgi:hypothetical protein